MYVRKTQDLKFTKICSFSTYQEINVEYIYVYMYNTIIHALHTQIMYRTEYKTLLLKTNLSQLFAYIV